MNLALVLLTAVDDPDGERARNAQQTLVTTLKGLGDQPVHLHIADDGSPAPHIKNLIDVVHHYGAWSRQPYTTSNSERGGYGRNMNLALQVVHDVVGPGGLVLPLEDDWECRAPIPVRRFADALLDEEAEIECIRLGYLGWTGELRGRLVAAGDRSGPHWTQQHYLLFDPDSSERHLFAGHPRIETVAFERRIGPWPEGLAPGETEFAVCGRPESREGVAWPLEICGPLFVTWGVPGR